MLRASIKRFTRFVAIVLSVLGVLISTPEVAQAAGVSLGNAPDIVNVVTVYPTTAATQSKVLSEVSKAEASIFADVPGFQDSAILKAQDSDQVIALSQWKGKDLTSFASYAEEHVLNIPAGQSAQSFACSVQQTETRAHSPTFEQGDVLQFSQFKMKPGSDQSELAGIVSQMMPGVLQMASGLQWVAMCPSTDESTIALLARWNSREDFESLAQQPGFDSDTGYWQTYANNEHGLYDVVEVIR